MMASQQTKLHDPMYNFDTHFPEKLSRLHLHSEVPGSFRKKRSRAERNSARYKTQPVTFDEIKEVDEEPTAPEEKLKPEKLMGQLQAFSRSMDGLIPKGVLEGHGHFHPHGSHSRSGSRKFHRHPDCIPEKVEAEQQLQQQQQQQQQVQKLQQLQQERGEHKECASSTNSRVSPLQPPSQHEKENPSVAVTTDSAPSSPVSPSQPEVGVSDVMANMAPRRQKVTAKAKKRQKASEEGQIN